MRKKLKNSLLEIFDTIFEAHNSVREFVKNNEYEKAVSVLGDCQDAAVKIGGFIEESEGEDCPVISLLLKYCEELYHISLELSEDVSVRQLKKRLDKALFAAQKSFEENVKVKLEVVFLPYKASMWDSLESVWKAADDDPECDAYVVPIPYYDRNPDHSFGEFHYEGNQYPDYVPVVYYEDYDFENRRPDVIYIHNPYDDYNYVTSVDPRYYSRELKKYTDCLVYIPYFLLEEVDPFNEKAIKAISHFIDAPAVFNADKVILQSENMKKVYINEHLRFAIENGLTGKFKDKTYLNDKFSGVGSPKIIRIKKMTDKGITVPKEWNQLIFNADGVKKKVILYNTGISGLLNFEGKWLNKLENTFRVFQECKEKAVLLWRPHPLIESTLSSMLPELSDKYTMIKNWFINDNLGIYDDSADVDRAIVLSDAYYGDPSSIICLYESVRKPVMIQNIEVL